VVKKKKNSQKEKRHDDGNKRKRKQQRRQRSPSTSSYSSDSNASLSSHEKEVIRRKKIKKRKAKAEKKKAKKMKKERKNKRRTSSISSSGGGSGGGFNGNEIANQLLIDHDHAMDEEINAALQASAAPTTSRSWKDEVNGDNNTTTAGPVPVPEPARRSSAPATLASTTTTSSSTNSTYTHINNVNGDKTTYAITIENEKKHAADYSDLIATGDTAVETKKEKKKKKKKKKKPPTPQKISTSMVPMTKELYDQQQLLEQIRIKEQRIIHNKFANQEAKDSFAYKKAIKEGVAQFKRNEVRNHSSNKKLRCVKGGVS